MENYENNDIISILEIITVLRRNLGFILMVSLLGLVLSTGYSLYRTTQYTITNEYSLTTLINVDTLSLSEENIAMISFTLSHPENVLQAQRKLDISGEYEVQAKLGDEEGIILLTINGNQGPALLRLSRELFNITKPIVESTLLDVELRKLEINSPIIISTTSSNDVNWVLNSLLGLFVGLFASVFYVLSYYFLAPSVVTEREIERLFGTKIIGHFVQTQPKSILKKLFEVKL